jgi:5-formyltetrahydrofolate cyclo-ligase
MCHHFGSHLLRAGRFGILEPDGPPFVGPIDLIIVPGLAFGRDGSRLGYGGGYYDRFLARPEQENALRCGAGYPFQLVDCLPTEPHDVPLTHVATPSDVVFCGT